MSPTTRTAIAGALLALVALGGTTGVAEASTTGPSGATTTGPGHERAVSSHFVAARDALETQLQARATRLGDLASDVQSARSLTAAHAGLLSERIQAEQADIADLIAAVPGDTTWAELRAHRKAMLSDNRVYAVMSPQVFLTIGADSASAQAEMLSADQSTLLSEVNSLVGAPGYTNALNHYRNWLRRTTDVATDLARVEMVVLNQTPARYPGNARVFLSANHAVLNATVSLAYASYDASIIGLSAGGYSGS